MSDFDPDTLDGRSPGGHGGDAADEAYAGVGNEFRLVRVSAGYELDAVSSALRIRRAYLEAIEEGRFADLPGPVYALGFIRSYAEYLGLEGDMAVKLFKDEARGLKARTKLVFPSPAEEGNMPRAALIAFSLLVAGAVWGVWQFRSSSDLTVVEAVSEVPERLAGLVAGADEEATEDSRPTDATPVSAGESAAGQAVKTEAVARREEAADAPAPIETAATLPTEVTDPRSSQPETAATELATEPAAGPIAEPAAEPAAAERAVSQSDVAETGREPVEETPRVVAAVEAPPPPSPPPPVAGPDPSMILPAPPGPEPATVQAPPSALPARAAVPVLPPRLDELMTSAPPSRTVAREPAPAAPAPPPVAAPSADGTGGYVPRIYGAGNKDFRVVLRAEHDSWVQIQGANNELVLTRMLRAGDTYLVPDRDDLIMMTGNAGGLEIVVDGRAIPRMGPEGAVRRNISLAAERLLELAAAVE